MAHRLEVALKPGLFDAEGDSVRVKAKRYFGIEIDSVRTIHVLTIDADLSPEQLEQIRTDVFTNPVTQVSSYKPLAGEFDWALWVGYQAGSDGRPRRDGGGSGGRRAAQAPRALPKPSTRPRCFSSPLRI